MKNFIAAIQFITILPTWKNVEFRPVGMISFFPLVGLLIGSMVAVFDIFAQWLWQAQVASVLDVILIILITGAFHLDGLGDAADGLLGHRPIEKVLLIMKDSRVGVMGLVAILCAFAIKCAGIAGINMDRTLLLLIIPAYSRASMIFGIRYLEYGRQDGTGHALFTEKISLSAFWAFPIPVFLSLFLGQKAVLLNISFCVIVAIILFYYKKRMNCITGDMLGAMTEITESLLFLIVSALGV